MRLTLIFSFLGIALELMSQPYVTGGKTRHRFAQLNFGTDLRGFLPWSQRTGPAILAGPLLENRFIIGGTHFWGHADFYIAIPVAAPLKNDFKTGTETGFKFFPWALSSEKLRPFVAVAVMPVSFRRNEGALMSRLRYPLSAGLVWLQRNKLIEVSLGFDPATRLNYYTSRTSVAIVKTPPVYAALSFKYMLETTLSAEKAWNNGSSRYLADSLGKAGRLNGFSIALGPSSAFFLKRSAHTQQRAPYADDHRFSDVFPELGLGYYWYRPDLQVNYVWRRVQSQISAHGYTQQLKRSAHTLELFHFAGDYHGFVPFFGAAISYERLYARESEDEASHTWSRDRLKGGITIGWDIRPDRLQSWYLRTNIRYFPSLYLDAEFGKISLDQLEVNFIQLVIYPQRFFRR